MIEEGKEAKDRTAAFALCSCALKGRQNNSRHVFLSGSYFESGGPGALLDLVGDVAGGVGCLGEGESGELHDTTHLALCLEKGNTDGVETWWLVSGFAVILSRRKLEAIGSVTSSSPPDTSPIKHHSQQKKIKTTI
jgi:hypothetical protein